MSPTENAKNPEKGSKRLQMNLLENAFDYLNASLEYVVRSRQNKSQKAWKFAILNITFAIELILKERLRRENELLIYANLDSYKPITRETRTVSWNVLIERIKFVIGESFSQIDAGRLSLAQKLRNQMLHYDVHLDFPASYHDYANMLNFITQFYNQNIRQTENDTLHNYIKPELWREEEDLSRSFIEEIVYFNGIFMAKELKEEIEQEQLHPSLLINGNIFTRIAFGSIEEGYEGSWDYSKGYCHDCNVTKGQYHLLGCDMEKCPNCKNQLITCGCNYEYGELN